MGAFRIWFTAVSEAPGLVPAQWTLLNFIFKLFTPNFVHSGQTLSRLRAACRAEHPEYSDCLDPYCFWTGVCFVCFKLFSIYQYI